MRECDILDKFTFDDLQRAKKSVQLVSLEKRVNLCGSGPIAGIVTGKNEKMTIADAKRKNLLPSKCADFLLDAQAATGHIIDPINNKKLTVDEAYVSKLFDISDKERLSAAEKAAVGFKEKFSDKPLSVFEAMKKGIIDNQTGLRLLQAQLSVGGILDPNLSVYVPMDIAMKRNLLNESTLNSLNTSSKCYIDPETEEMTSYTDLMKQCQTEPQTGLVLLKVTEKGNASKLVFDGLRKPVSAQQLYDCGILDKSTINYLITGKKSLTEVSVNIQRHLKGNNPIAGIIVENKRKMSLTEAKKQKLLTPECANLLLEAQAATGFIIDPTMVQKLTVDQACAKHVLDSKDQERLMAAEAAVDGYKDPSSSKRLSVFEAMKKGIIDEKTGLRLLQAQLSVGGIVDPNLGAFLPVDSALKQNMVDESTYSILKQNPPFYLDPENGNHLSYDDLKKKCQTEPTTGLLLLPIHAKADVSKLIFEGVCKSVTAQQLLDCGLLDMQMFEQLKRGEKSVLQVSVEKRLFLKGSGSIAGITTGPFEKCSPSEAKKQRLISSECADLLLEAQAATGHLIDPKTNQTLTVDEAYRKGMFDLQTRDRLLVAEAAAVGFKDPTSPVPLSVFEALNKGIVDKSTALRLLQAQDAAGGIIDPTTGVFLPKDKAIKRHILDENVYQELAQNPSLYIDPNTEEMVSYNTLKKRSRIEPATGLMLLPLQEREDSSKMMFEGIHKQISVQELFDCQIIDKTTFSKLSTGEKTIAQVSKELNTVLKGTGPIAGIQMLQQCKMSFFEAKKLSLLPSQSADLLLEAQAATGYIIDPRNNRKLTVNQAFEQRLLDIESKDKLVEAEKAAYGFKDNDSENILSLYQAMKKGLIKRESAMRLLQAQMSVGGIMDPCLGVFLPKDAAIRRHILDEDTWTALKTNRTWYVDPETGKNVSYEDLQKKCLTETNMGLKLLPLSKNIEPSNIIFNGVRKSISAHQLLKCGVISQHIFDQLIKGVKSIYDVIVEKEMFFKGTGSIAGVAAGPMEKMSFKEAKKNRIFPPESINLLLEAQAATGLIIDPSTNERMTVKEALARDIVDRDDESRLLAAEKAAEGYKDPTTNDVLSAGQAFKKGLIDMDTALRVLQAQEAAGGILDPVLSIFLPRDIAMARNLIDEDIKNRLLKVPQVYLDPDTQKATDYNSLKKKCMTDSSTGLLLLPQPQKHITLKGLRRQVSLIELVDANLLQESDMNLLEAGKITCEDIENRLRSYLRGSNCIAGIYHEASDKILTIYQAMKTGLLRPGTTLELLEAQAASGFIIDPVNNDYLSVSEAFSKRLFGPEFKNKLLSAERAVTGYKMPGTDRIISLFQAMDQGLIEKGHGIRLLEAQIASGGIIDPEHSHRIDVTVAYKKGYFDEEMNKILTDDSDDTKGFFDPNTQENLTYLDLQNRCIKDETTGLLLLPIFDRKKYETSQKKRKRRVVIVDPETNKEMSVHEAFDKGYIDHETYCELSLQECDWEEITLTAPDGSTRLVIIDRRSGRQFDIGELLEKRVINQILLQKYQSHLITLPDFADIIIEKTKHSAHFAAMPSQTVAVPSSSSLTAAVPSFTAELTIDDSTKPGSFDSTKKSTVSNISSVKTSTVSSKSNAQSSTLSSFEPSAVISSSTTQLTDAITGKSEHDVTDSSKLFKVSKYSTISNVSSVKSSTVTSKTSHESSTSPRTSSPLWTVPESVIPQSTDAKDNAFSSAREYTVSVRSSTFKSETSSEPSATIVASSSAVLTSPSAATSLAPQLIDATIKQPKSVTDSSRPSAISKVSVVKTSSFTSKTSPELSTSSLGSVSSATSPSSTAQPEKISHQTENDSYSSATHSTVSSISSVKSSTVTSKITTELAPSLQTSILTSPLTRVISEKDKHDEFDSSSESSVSSTSSTFTSTISIAPSSTSLEISKLSSVQTLPSISASSSTTQVSDIIKDKTKGSVFDSTGRSTLPNISIVKTSTTYTSRTSEELEPMISTMASTGSATSSEESNAFLQTSLSAIPTSPLASSTIVTDKSTALRTDSKTVSKTSYVTTTSTLLTSKTSSELNTSSLTPTLSTDFPTSPEISFTLSPLSPSPSTRSTTRTTTITEQYTSMSDDFSDLGKHSSSVSITLTPPVETVVTEQNPVGGIFDTDALEKITITEAVNRGLVDSITGQRLLEAQACTGGIIDPTNGQRVGIQEAVRMGIITYEMQNRLKAAQKAYVGFEDVKTKKKMSAAEAINERWLPYEAGNRFLEYQFVTGGLFDPQMGCRRSLQDALNLGWVDVRTAQKLQNTRHHTKNLTCPKSKLKISYKEALDNCLLEENTGVRMLQASSVSSKGISSPYNVSSAPGSQSGSRSGSRLGSRRSSVDLGSSSIASPFSHTSFTAYTSTK